VASDPTASQEELRLLELMRHRLDIERLAAAGIERGAAARFIRPNGSVAAMRQAS
jgi:transposase